LLLVVRALVVKGQSILLRTLTLRPDNAVEPAHHQNRTKRGSHVLHVMRPRRVAKACFISSRKL